MNCPKCKLGEIEPAGVCPVCGHGIVKAAQPAMLPFPANENILSFPAERVKKKIESSSPLRVVKEKPVPSWRLEVSQKVQQVLRARENKNGAAALPAVEVAVAVAGSSGVGGAACAPPAPPVFRQSATVVIEQPVIETDPCLTGLAAPTTENLQHAATDSGVRASGTLAPLFSKLVVDAAPPAIPRTTGYAPRSLKETALEAMNESAIAIDTSPVQNLEAPDFQMDYPPDIGVLLESAPAVAADQHGLLLSRTLSGLIDLITVLFSAIPFFFTLVYLLGYEEIDGFELSVLLGVCSALFLLYSVFFVTFSGQTIGMMITNLQVVDARGELPSYGRAFKRVIAFLLAFGMGGLGLLWGIVDRKRRCLHDLLSNTTVIRVDSAEIP